MMIIIIIITMIIMATWKVPTSRVPKSCRECWKPESEPGTHLVSTPGRGFLASGSRLERVLVR